MRIPHPAKKIPALSRGARLSRRWNGPNLRTPGFPQARRLRRRRRTKSRASRSASASWARSWPLGVLLAKFGKVALLLLTKAKFLTTSGSMLVSIAAYSPDLGLDVRGRLRGAAVRPRDGPRHPAAPRGRAAERAGVHPVPRRRRRRAARSAARALAEARVGPRRPGARHARARSWSPASTADRQRLLARARVHRLLPQPLQPAARRCRSTAAARWPRWRRGCGSSASPRC